MGVEHNILHRYTNKMDIYKNVSFHIDLEIQSSADEVTLTLTNGCTWIDDQSKGIITTLHTNKSKIHFYVVLDR